MKFLSFQILTSFQSTSLISASTAEVFLLAEDTKQALHLVKPSAMREVLVEVPNVIFFFESIGCSKIQNYLNLFRCVGQISEDRLS
jgi:hypothetical protein